jgi:hypothetical protein
MSVMKPSRPWLMPISGVPWRPAAADAQHGAVAAHHQAQVAARADFLDVSVG